MIHLLGVVGFFHVLKAMGLGMISRFESDFQWVSGMACLPSQAMIEVEDH